MHKKAWPNGEWLRDVPPVIWGRGGGGVIWTWPVHGFMKTLAIAPVSGSTTGIARNKVFRCGGTGLLLDASVSHFSLCSIHWTLRLCTRVPVTCCMQPCVWH